MSETPEAAKLRQIDTYIQDLCSAEDDALTGAIENMRRNELPAINVSANEGKLLYMLAKLSGARKVLEIGTLGAYSTIWLARGLPSDGTVLTLEYSPKHADVARANLQRAGLADRVEVRVGAGLELLPHIEANGEGPFDLVFIDADKDNYPGYLEWAIKLSHSGTVILSDNLIRDGSVINPPEDNVSAEVIAEYNRELNSNPRLETIILPIIRESTDGLGITVVK